jgi:hypothetical protein
MSESQRQPEPQQNAETSTGPSLLEQAIGATKQTERSRAEDLMRALTSKR